MLPNSKTYFNWFLLFYALWGFYTMPDYGVPLDELTQRTIGMENNRFLMGGSPEKIESHGAFGPVFESISYLLEQVIYNQPIRYKLYLRHVLLFSVFLLALRCFYFIGKRLFKKPNIAGITAISLALYPPLFVHTHINSKDSFFLCLVIFSLYFLVRFFEAKNWKHLFLMSFILGMASTIRITGFVILIIFITGLFLRKEIKLIPLLKYCFLIIGISFVTFYALFPYLWLHPLDGIYKILVYTSNNPWPSETLCAGSWITPGKATWWYLPVWLGVTIPLVTIIGFLIGIFRIFTQSTLRNNATIFVLIALFFVPIILVLFMQPTLYDGWRHFQFLIVPMVLLSGFGLEYIPTGKYHRTFSWAIAGYACITFFIWNPYGYVYMNEIYAMVFKPNTFTQDYWGLSSKPTLEWIAKNDSSSQIKIYSFTESPWLNNQYLSKEISKKFQFVSTLDSANYHIELRRQRYFGPTLGKEVYSICPMKDTIVRVVKLNAPIGK